MNFRKTICCLFLGLLATAVCRPATAALTLGFSIDNGSNFSESFDLLTGESVAVGVYLNDDVSGGILETAGFFGFGLTAAAPTTFGTISAASIDPLYDFGTIDQFTGSTIDWEAAIFLNSTPTGQSILIGSFQFDATADGSTVLTFGDRLVGTGPVNAGWLDGLGNELDQSIFGPGATGTFQLTITSTTIPEPGTSGLMVAALIGVAVRRKRRIRNQM